ncbi:sporulation protein YqfD [Clostridia bacterium]|nr:sporulation protein YqfD [Clostridia bacterium]
MNAGSISVRCRGQKLNKFINALRVNSVECRSSYTKQEEFFASILYIDIKKFKRIAKEYNIEVFIENKKGILPGVLKYKKRYGIIIGLFIAASFIMYVSNTVMTVEVKGNERVSNGAIFSVAKNLGIKKGKNVQNINYSQAEKSLMSAIPEISWANIQHTGNRVLITVAEMKTAPEIMSKSPCNIIVTKDAVVTKVTVRTGQLFGLVGMPVKKGQVVISGIYTSLNNQNHEVHAEGEIIGRYSEHMIFTQPFKETKTIYGNIKTSKKIDFFGLKIPVDFALKGNKTYNITVEDTPFQIFKKDLPIGIIKNNYEEVLQKEFIYSLEEANNLLEKQVTNYEKNFLENMTILDKKCNFNATSEYLQFDITYKIEGEIGQESPLFIK